MYLRVGLAGLAWLAGCVHVPPPPAPGTGTVWGYVRLIAAHMLKQAGARVDVAADGREALAAIERERYDLVFVDVDMPEIAAFEAGGATRQRVRSGRATAVIGMAAATDDARARCLAAGMNDCITKPLQTAALQAALARWTGRAKGPAAAGDTGAAARTR